MVIDLTEDVDEGIIGEGIYEGIYGEGIIGEGIDEGVYRAWLKEYQYVQIPRISACDVARSTGLHTWVHPSAMVERYLYQDLDKLRTADEEALGLNPAPSVEVTMQQLMSRLGNQEREMINDVLQAAPATSAGTFDLVAQLQSVLEPVAEAEAEPEAEAGAGAVAEPIGEAEAEPVTEAVAESLVAAEAEAAPEVAASAETEAAPMPTAEIEPGSPIKKRKEREEGEEGDEMDEEGGQGDQEAKLSRVRDEEETRGEHEGGEGEGEEEERREQPSVLMEPTDESYAKKAEEGEEEEEEKEEEEEDEEEEVEEEVVMPVLTADERRNLLDLLNTEVRQNFGVRAEAPALDAYELQRGVRVVERNVDTVCLPVYVYPVESASGGQAEECAEVEDRVATEPHPRVSFVAPGFNEIVLPRRCLHFDHPGERDAWKQIELEEADGGEEGRGGEVEEAAVEESGAEPSPSPKSLPATPSQPSKPATAAPPGHPIVPSASLPTPAFYIKGRCDGLVYRQTDQGLGRIAIEMKNRCGGSKPSAVPPLYDIVQLSVYMVMYRCCGGELVQSTAVAVPPPSPPPAAAAAAAAASASAQAAVAFTSPTSSQYAEMEQRAMQEATKRGWEGRAVLVTSPSSQDQDGAEGGGGGHVENRENSQPDVPSPEHQKEGAQLPLARKEQPPMQSSTSPLLLAPVLEAYDVDMVVEPVAPRIAYSLNIFHVPSSGQAAFDGYDHAGFFHSHVLPRLAEFVALLQRLRRQDTLRLLWLNSDEEMRKEIISRELSYLRT